MGVMSISVTIWYLMLLGDLIINAFAETTKDPGMAFMMLGIQQGLLVFILLVLFVLVSRTFMFQRGLLGLAFREFRGIMCIVPLYMIISIGLRIFRALTLSAYAVYNQQNPALTQKTHLDVWNEPWYLPYFIAHGLVSMAFYYYNIITSRRFGDVKLYREELWWRGMRDAF